MVKRNGANDEPRPELRIAGYVPGHAEPVADPEPSEPTPAPRDLPPALPNISDYWPDTPRRQRAEPPPVPMETMVTDRRARRPAVMATLLAVAVAAGAFLLSRPLTSTDSRPVAAAPTTATATVPATEAPASVAPANVAPSATPTTAATPSTPVPPALTAPTAEAPAPPPKPPAVTEARFELVTGVTELIVRTADLDGAPFRVTTPKDSGLDVDAAFTGGTLRVRADPDGAASGSGRVDVLLSSKVVWRLRMGAGVHAASFDMGGGTVREIDLIGGAQAVDLELGRLDETLPILMGGGIHTWRIRTSERVPVKVALGSGTGALTVYGDERGGISGGETVRDGDLGDRPGLDIDAEAGVGSLKISRT